MQNFVLHNRKSAQILVKSIVTKARKQSWYVSGYKNNIFLVFYKSHS